jgi:hypothetical protein
MAEKMLRAMTDGDLTWKREQTQKKKRGGADIASVSKEAKLAANV